MSLIDATVNGTFANCYITLADALTRYATMLNGQAFIDLGDPDKQEKILIQATQRIDRITEWDYDMIGHSRTTITQALLFARIGTLNRAGDNWYPSDIIPPFILDALLQQGIYEMSGNLDAEPAGKGIKRMKADVLEIEYDDSGAAAMQQSVSSTVYTILDPWLLGSPTGSDKYGLYNNEILRV